MKNLYACPYISELHESVSHAERVINGSSEDTKWWKQYRFKLLKRMLRHQLREFDRNFKFN